MARPTGLRLKAPFRRLTALVLSGASLVVALPLAAATVGAYAAAALASPALQGTSTLSWHRCDRTFRCSDVVVPLDYAHPARAQLKIALIELPSTSKHPMGDSVTNPGGPGGSGIEFLEGQDFPPALVSLFNVVSFDPRGIGASDPVTCVGTAEMRTLAAANPDPVSKAQVTGLVQQSELFNRACAEHTSRSLLENVSTLDVARDLDRIRIALGQPKLDYMGFSYGTYLGELYAELFLTGSGPWCWTAWSTRPSR